jgi:hypothetical protein
MKKMNLMIAVMAVAAGLSMNVQADEAKKQEVVAAPAAAPAAAPVAAAASKLSADEQAFAAKLSEQNRKAFEQFTADQKKAAMAASCAQGSCNKTAMSPNDAVQKAIKDQSAAVADKAAPAAAAPAAKAPAQAK